MSWAAIIIGGASLAYGAYSKGRANKKTKDALKKRQAYQTPEEVFTILNALTNKAQGDTQTRDFNTTQIDRSFSNVLNTAELLGGDPNDLSALFDQKMQGIIQVGDQFHRSNMEAFGKYIGALDMVAKNKTGEWQTQQDIVKDSLQAAASDGQAANATINSGLNSIIGGVAANQTMNLYKEQNGLGKYGNTGQPIAVSPQLGGGAGFDSTVASPALNNAGGGVVGFTEPQSPSQGLVVPNNALDTNAWNLFLWQLNNPKR